KPEYRNAEIILGGVNFGCGSSREHAVWALAEYGFRAIIAPSFAPIFQANCVTNGILPVELPEEAIARLADAVAADPQSRKVHIDLPAQTVTGPDGAAFRFEIGEEAKEMLVEGLDPIDLTLKQRDRILAVQEQARAERPWSFL